MKSASWIATGVAALIAHASSTSIFAVPAAEWAALNRSVEGRLHGGQPLALPCYSTYDNGETTLANTPNATACAAISSGESNDTFINSASGGYISYNFGTCGATNQGCPVSLTGQLLGTCYQGSVAPYYIDVRKPRDAAAGLAFAQKHAIPLVVKNTGHDYKGRSSAPNSLALWTHNVQPAIKFTKAFVPDGGSTSAGSTLTYGAGQGFRGIFEAAHANGYMAVGGTSPTVGASGGWLAGGGHSGLSTTYGLGVDNVVQLRVVLPNGTYITSNRHQHTDLFFALRGGGGGTFGVVMETTARVYPEVPIQVASITAVTTGTDAVKKVVDLLINNTAKWSEDGWGGYMAVGYKGLGLLFISFINPKLTLAEAKASMKPATDLASLFNGSVPVSVNISTEANYLDYFNSNAAQSLAGEGVGDGLAAASRMVPKSSFETAEGREQLSNTFVDLANNSPVPFGILMVTPTQYDLPQSDQPGGPGHASITPAWRTSYWHTLWMQTWQQDDATYGGFGSAFAAFNATTHAANPLRAITPEGAYQNEGDTYEPNPAASFWGEENYHRLSMIKAEVDPHNVLTCHQCVGWNASDARFSCYPDVVNAGP